VGSEPLGKFSTLSDFSSAYQHTDSHRHDPIYRVLNMELLQFYVSVRCVPALRIDSEVIVAFRLGCWFDGVRQSGGDVPREELVDAVDGMIGDASQQLV